MTYPVNALHLDPNTEFFSEVDILKKEATEYLKSFTWCNEINNIWLYTNVGKAMCIFLFKIENNQSEQDNLIWIVAGDFPVLVS